MIYNDLMTGAARERALGFGLPVVGWFCSYTPVELLDAAGVTPVRIAGAHATTSAADSIMHTNICPYIKSCLDAALAGNLDFLDAAVFTNGCDAQRRLYDVWKFTKSEIPAHIVIVPKTDGPDSVRAFAVELSDLRNWLNKTFGREISDDDVSASIARYVKLRAKLAELDSPRLKEEAAITGSRMMEVYMAAQRMPAAAALEAIGAELDALKSAPAAAPRGPKVLLAGNMTDDPEWLRQIESYGARVVADDLCTGRRFRVLPPPDAALPPLDALAAAYLTKPACPRMAGKRDYVDEFKKTVGELKPDGVIFHILKFCDTHMYNVPYLREALRDMDVKSMFIEGDYTSGSGQLATRLQAFIEML